MLLTIPIDVYNRQFLIFLPPVKNNLMENSLFTRIIYSPLNIMFSGIYIHIPLSYPIISINRSLYHLIHDQIHQLLSIENDILNAYSTTKNATYSLEKTLKQRTLVGKHTIVLKISGIWENNDCYGLAYKFIFI
jgi:hypothetical protein